MSPCRGPLLALLAVSVLVLSASVASAATPQWSPTAPAALSSAPPPPTRVALEQKPSTRLPTGKHLPKTGADTGFELLFGGILLGLGGLLRLQAGFRAPAR